MEYEIRFYYPLSKYNYFFNYLEKIDNLKNNGRKYEKTLQYNHPNQKYDFYSNEIDGRFRIRITKDEKEFKCKLSWKRRLSNTVEIKINCEEEVELSIDFNEYDNLIYILEKVIHMNLVECYERYRTIFVNDEIEIALDEYPFGLALEIEAKGNCNNSDIVIDKYVKILNLDYNDMYRLSWDDKYEELCKEQNIEKRNFVLFGKEIPVIKEK